MTQAEVLLHSGEDDLRRLQRRDAGLVLPRVRDPEVMRFITEGQRISMSQIEREFGLGAKWVPGRTVAKPRAGKLGLLRPDFASHSAALSLA